MKTRLAHLREVVAVEPTVKMFTADAIRVIETELSAAEKVIAAGKILNDVACKAVFKDGHEERLLIENWPLMDALAQFREAVGGYEKEES